MNSQLGILEPDPGESSVVQAIFEQAGHARLGSQSLAHWLNARGYRARGEGLWSARTALKLLRNQRAVELLMPPPGSPGRWARRGSYLLVSARAYARSLSATTAAAVVASAAVATAERKARWTSVAQIRSGTPSTTARPTDHPATIAVGTQRVPLHPRPSIRDCPGCLPGVNTISVCERPVIRRRAHRAARGRGRGGRPG